MVIKAGEGFQFLMPVSGTASPFSLSLSHFYFFLTISFLNLFLCQSLPSSVSLAVSPSGGQSTVVRASTASRRCRARLYWAWFSGRISIRRPTSLLVCGRGTRGHRSSLGSCRPQHVTCTLYFLLGKLLRHYASEKKLLTSLSN